MPRDGTLACVFAHPDDDAYGAAGSVALHANEPDFRFVLVHATSGENGENRAPPSTLGAVRRAEQCERRVCREWYSIAWPEHGAAMLTDLFDGVA